MSASSLIKLVPLRDHALGRPASWIGPNTWFAVLASLIVATCLDPFHTVSEGSFKQIPLLLTLGVSAFALRANRLRLDVNLPAPACAMLVLLLIAIPGLMVNKLDGAESSLFTAVSLLVVPLSVFVLPRNWVEQDARTWLRWLGLIAIAFVVGAFMQLELNRREMTYIRIHERAFLVPLAILVPVLLRRRIACFMGTAAVGLILVSDPRTTLLLVVAITASTWLYIFRLGAQGRRLALAVLAAGAVLGATVGGDLLRIIDDHYKGAMGMKGNSDFRQNLIEVGIAEFKRSPIVGDFFRGPTSFDSGTYEIDERGQYQVIMAPLHNDYIEFATKGGVIGVSLLIAGLLGSVLLAIGNRQRFLRAGLIDHANWQGLLAIVVGCLMFTMLVNPVLNNAGCSVPAYFMVAQVWMGYRHARRLQRLASTTPEGAL